MITNYGTIPAQSIRKVKIIFVISAGDRCEH